MYWLFNQNKLPISGDQIERISWNQKGNFRGQVGDRVIFFQFLPNTKLFTYLYEIGFTEQSRISLDSIAITLQLRFIENYNQDKAIENYIYSFPRIKHYTTRLGRHFNRRYYSLSEPEYSAIVHDQIFWPRTILGIALNALHVDHRHAFLRFLFEENPNVLLNDYNHETMLEMFRQYFRFAIEVPAKQFTDAVEIARTIVGDEIVRNIAFADQRGNTDLISAQYNIIMEYLELYNESIRSEQQFSETSFYFQRMFQGKPLPVSIND